MCVYSSTAARTLDPSALRRRLMADPKLRTASSPGVSGHLERSGVSPLISVHPARFISGQLGASRVAALRVGPARRLALSSAAAACGTNVSGLTVVTTLLQRASVDLSVCLSVYCLSGPCLSQTDRFFLGDGVWASARHLIER